MSTFYFLLLGFFVGTQLILSALADLPLNSTEIENIDTGVAVQYDNSSRNATDLPPSDSVAKGLHPHKRKRSEHSSSKSLYNIGDQLNSASVVFEGTVLLEQFLAEEKASLLMSDKYSENDLDLILKATSSSLKSVLENEFNRQCVTDIVQVLKAVRKRSQWALEMLDATGKPGSGVLRENVLFLGDFDECMELHTGQNFQSHYCSTLFVMMRIKNTTFSPPFKSVLGLCVPSSCGSKDTERVMNAYLALSHEIIGGVAHTECHDRHLQLSTKAKVVICIVSMCIAIVVAATAFDVCKGMLTESDGIYSSSEGVEDQEVKDSHLFTSGERYSEKKPIVDMDKSLAKSYSGNQPNRQERITKWTVGKELLLCFSLRPTTETLLSTSSQPQGSIDCIHGIRVIAMAWVILFRTFGLFAPPVFDNKKYFLDSSYNNWTFIIIPNGEMSIDSFFAISGLLVTYVVLRKVDKETLTPTFFGGFFLRRFLRLTPSYMLMLALDAVFIQYINDGPFWKQKGFETDECEDTWWANLFYINNFVKDDKMCMYWSWYLTVEMQLYFLSPLLFLPMLFYQWRGLLVALVFLAGNVICSGVISSANNLPGVQRLEYLGPGEANTYFTVYYIKPYTRMGPYIIGMMTGFLLFNCELQARIPKWMNALGWMCATAVALAVVCGPYDHYADDPADYTELNALYNAFHRIAWGICVCWVIFTCATGNADFLNRFLSWKAFVPLDRLTHGVYLVHTMLFAFSHVSQKRPTYLQTINLIYLYVATLAGSYVASLIPYLLAEGPMAALEKVFKRHTKAFSE